MCLSCLFLGLCIWLLVYVYVCWCSYCLSFGIGKCAPTLFLRSENAQMLPYHEIEDHKSWFWWCSIGNVLNDMVCLTIMAQFHQQKAIFKCWNPALQWYCEQKVAADNQKPTKAVISLHHQVIWYWDLMLKKTVSHHCQNLIMHYGLFCTKKTDERTGRQEDHGFIAMQSTFLSFIMITQIQLILFVCKNQIVPIDNEGIILF
mgnify:CR=1 FL=1